MFFLHHPYISEPLREMLAVIVTTKALRESKVQGERPTIGGASNQRQWVIAAKWHLGDLTYFLNHDINFHSSISQWSVIWQRSFSKKMHTEYQNALKIPTLKEIVCRVVEFEYCIETRKLLYTLHQDCAIRYYGFVHFVCNTQKEKSRTQRLSDGTT